jgi:hypothetical protein
MVLDAVLVALVGTIGWVAYDKRRTNMACVFFGAAAGLLAGFALSPLTARLF